MSAHRVGSVPAERRLRVLHVSQPVVAGVAEVVVDLVAAQTPRGWDVHLACPEGPLAQRASAGGAHVHRWQAERSPGWSTLSECRRLRQVIREIEPDVVHLHSSKAGLVGRLVVRGRLPTIFQPHAWSFLSVGATQARAVAFIERHLDRWTQILICGSGDERDVGRRAGIRTAARVIRNSVDTDRFPERGDADRRAARAALDLASVPIAVCVGRLCKQKGQDVLLAAWPDVLARLPSAMLILVGDGPLADELAALAVPRVRFAGWQDDVAPWITSADLVVQPSRYETLSLATLEAMSTGRSVVVSDAGGTLEAVDEYSGAVVPVDDVRNLADEITRRLSDLSHAHAEGASARRRVVADFGRQAWASAMVAATEDAARPAARRSGADVMP